ncbi:MAG TPA: serine dehydratase beta chain, partial [Tepidisphaeraceae bacterium]|nr:serine dehydratase beta chain [Tepidisphaeraceae bacterium]
MMLNILSKSSGGCGPCASTGCGTCGTETTAAFPAPQPSRRALGRAVLSASAGLAIARLAGAQAPAASAAQEASAPPPLAPNLNVVQQSKGPILTVLDEFYKMGPGPSSSHTMGPMRITYDFYQRVSKLPEDQLKRATALKVHLYGSLSQTGEGHGTNRAALAGLLGKAPATCPPEFLDSISARPDEVYQVNVGPTAVNVTLKDIIFDAVKGNFPHPNTM